MTINVSYNEEIRAFRKYVEGLLYDAWEDESNGNNEPIETLYNETFKLSFKGATIELGFGPDEFECIVECLENLERRVN